MTYVSAPKVVVCIDLLLRGKFEEPHSSNARRGHIAFSCNMGG